MAENHLLDALELSAKTAPNKIFATLRDQSNISYQAFFDGARKQAMALSGLGLQPGDRVAVQVEKSIPALQLYIATVMAGGVFLPLNTAYTAAEVSYFLNDATPQVFVCDTDKVMDLMPVAANAGIKSVLTMGADGQGSLVAVSDSLPDTFEAIERNAADLAAILYTSGTTGRSKGAMMSHRALEANSQTLKDLWQFTPDDVLIHALPIFHTHGLFVATNVALMAGASLLFHPKFDAGEIIRDLPAATAMMGVPTFYTRLLNHAGLTKKTTANMRLFISGSAPLLAETHDRWHSKNRPRHFGTLRNDGNQYEHVKSGRR